MSGQAESKPFEFPYKSLDDLETMIAMEEAGLEITIVATYSNREKRVIGKRAFIDRKALCFVTGRSQSTIDYWVNKNWLKPARKHGAYSLFAIEDVEFLLNMGRFPKANVDQIYLPKTFKWLNPPEEAQAEIDRQAAAKADEAGAPKRKRGAA